MKRWLCSIFALFCITLAACSNTPPENTASSGPSTAPSVVASVVASPSSCTIVVDHAEYTYRGGDANAFYKALATKQGCAANVAFQFRYGTKVVKSIVLTTATHDIDVAFAANFYTKEINITSSPLPRADSAPHPADSGNNSGLTLFPHPAISAMLPAQFSPVSDLKPGVLKTWPLQRQLLHE